MLNSRSFEPPDFRSIAGKLYLVTSRNNTSSFLILLRVNKRVLNYPVVLKSASSPFSVLLPTAEYRGMVQGGIVNTLLYGSIQVYDVSDERSKQIINMIKILTLMRTTFNPARLFQGSMLAIQTFIVRSEFFRLRWLIIWSTK